MAQTLDMLEAQALHLAPEDRRLLAHRLLASVETLDDSDGDEAWAHELNRRFQEVERGAVVCRSWDDVQADLERALTR